MPPKKSAKPQPVVTSNIPETQDGFTFEEELLWCIKKLEASLLSETITVKTLKSAVLALKTLKNSKAPLVKRRQVMRMSCGDYRKAMLEDVKKVKSESKKISLQPVTEIKSVTVARTSKSKENCKDSQEADSQQSTFCFNFPCPENEELRINFDELKICDSSSTVSH